MIVRIMGEGQVALAESHLAELNKLDEELLAEMDNGDGPGFRVAPSTALLNRVHELGEPLPDDSLEPSDLILPSPDATIEEVRELLSDDGDGRPGHGRRTDPGPMSPRPAGPPTAVPLARIPLTPEPLTPEPLTPEPLTPEPFGSRTVHRRPVHGRCGSHHRSAAGPRPVRFRDPVR
ncbi:hypothetical protein SHIRM173S_13243 [Streptomyces hirsutus]